MATDEKMKIDERYQYLQRMQRRYREANRSAKSALLDEMEAHTGMHRKALLRRLHSDLERKARSREREPTYGPEVDAALALIWEASDYVCPERLQPNLVSLAELLARHGELALPPRLTVISKPSPPTVSPGTPPNRDTSNSIWCITAEIPRKGNTSTRCNSSMSPPPGVDAAPSWAAVTSSSLTPWPIFLLVSLSPCSVFIPIMAVSS